MFLGYRASRVSASVFALSALLIVGLYLTVAATAWPNGDGSEPSSKIAKRAIPQFKVSVKARAYAKHGATGMLVGNISLTGAGLLAARPVITCNPKYCGRLARSQKQPRRSRLFKRKVTFSRVNWLIAKGHGFTVTLLPRNRKRLGLYAKVTPPDAYNKRFTIIAAGCVNSSRRVVDCPPGTRLPALTHRDPPAPVGAAQYPGGDELGVASLGPGRMTLFTRGTDGQLWHRVFVEGLGWTGWLPLGGNIISGPTAARSAPGRIDVFARGTDNTLQHLSFTDAAGWSAWKSLGGNIASTPAASSFTAGHIHVFARGGNNALLHRSTGNGGTSWSDWESLGGCMSSAPSSASWGPGRIDVFYRGCMPNDLQHKWFNADWLGPESLGGVLASAPAVVSKQTTQLEVFVLNMANAVVHKSFAAGWSAYLSLSSPVTVVSPAAVASSTDRIDVFSRNSGGSVVQTTWSPTNGWQAWRELGR